MKELFLGNNPVQSGAGKVEGQQVSLDGEDCYCIANSDRLRPFFMSIVSGADHWLFISSNGALTAGRRNPDRALFPYVTDDKIHDAADNTGPKSIFIVQTGGKEQLWEPLSKRGRGSYRTRRNLYKSLRGNRLTFGPIKDLAAFVIQPRLGGQGHPVALAAGAALEQMPCDLVRLFDRLQGVSGLAWLAPGLAPGFLAQAARRRFG